jgi:hypothetical protein
LNAVKSYECVADERRDMRICKSATAEARVKSRARRLRPIRGRSGLYARQNISRQRVSKPEYDVLNHSSFVEVREISARAPTGVVSGHFRTLQ